MKVSFQSVWNFSNMSLELIEYVFFKGFAKFVEYSSFYCIIRKFSNVDMNILNLTVNVNICYSIWSLLQILQQELHLSSSSRTHHLMIWMFYKL